MFEIEFVASSYDFDGSRTGEYRGTVKMPAPPTPGLHIYVGERQVLIVEEVYYDVEDESYTAYGAWSVGLDESTLNKKGWSKEWGRDEGDGDAD